MHGVVVQWSWCTVIWRTVIQCSENSVYPSPNLISIPAWISLIQSYQNRSTAGIEDVSTGRCGFVQRPGLGWLILLVLGDERGVLSCGFIYAQRELGN